MSSSQGGRVGLSRFLTKKKKNNNSKMYLGSATANSLTGNMPSSIKQHRIILKPFEILHAFCVLNCLTCPSDLLLGNNTIYIWSFVTVALLLIVYIHQVT